MRKSLFALTLIFITLWFSSCQKEISSDPIQRINGTGQLIKIINTYVADNFDTHSQEFEYDNNDSLWLIKTTLKNKQPNGTIITMAVATQFFRDGSGKIIRTGAMPDTSSWNILAVYESPLSSKLIHTKMTHKTGSVITVIDSVTFEYNTDNRITRRNTYDPVSGQLGSYQLFQYDAVGNLILRQQYLRNVNNSFDLNIAYGFEYDNRSNPLYAPSLSWVYFDPGWPTFLSPNNVIKHKNYYTPGSTDEHGYSYQYDSPGRPVSVIKKFESGGNTTYDSTNITRYYYN